MVYATVYKNIIRDSANRGGCPILNTAIDADDTNLLLKDRAVKALNNWEKNVKILIRQGIDAGEFKTDINVRQIALSIIALIEGGLVISRTTGDPSSIDCVLQTVEKLVSAMKI